MVRILAVIWCTRSLMCHLKRTNQQTQAWRNDQSHHRCLSLLLSSKLILLTKAGTADTEEIVLISFGPQLLGVCSFFLPHSPSLRNIFHGLLFFPHGVLFLKFICFEKAGIASMDWSCYFPYVDALLSLGYPTESDLMAYWSCPQDAAFHRRSIALSLPCSLP